MTPLVPGSQPPRVTMMLCDYAAVAEGKLYVSGGGWSQTGPQPSQSALALLIGLPWTMANQKIRFTIKLVTQDGEPVQLSAPQGGLEPVELGGEFEVGRPPGLAPGTQLDVPLAFTMGPMPLQPGQRYSWVLHINEETQTDWHVDFMTRPGPPPQT